MAKNPSTESGEFVVAVAVHDVEVFLLIPCFPTASPCFSHQTLRGWAERLKCPPRHAATSRGTENLRQYAVFCEDLHLGPARPLGFVLCLGREENANFEGVVKTNIKERKVP